MNERKFVAEIVNGLESFESVEELTLQAKKALETFVLKADKCDIQFRFLFESVEKMTACYQKYLGLIDKAENLYKNLVANESSFSDVAGVSRYIDGIRELLKSQNGIIEHCRWLNVFVLQLNNMKAKAEKEGSIPVSEFVSFYNDKGGFGEFTGVFFADTDKMLDIGHLVRELKIKFDTNS